MYIFREDDAPLADDPALVFEACETAAERIWDELSINNPAALEGVSRRTFILSTAQRIQQEYAS